MTSSRTLSYLALLGTASLSTAWQHFGQPVSTSGSIVKLSGNGERIAVGSPDGSGSVSVYEKESDTGHWTLIGKIQGDDGEGIGDFISLSEDGFHVAVRRYNVSPNVVQVYQATSNGLLMIGSNVQACDEDGQSLTLGRATSPSSTESLLFLVVGCESYDNNRGKVLVFRLFENLVSGQSTWEPYLAPLVGGLPGDRFGSATSFVEAPAPLYRTARIFRVAVSSPNYASSRGLVQVFIADEEKGWFYYGDDLVGEQIGEMFGASIAMSANEDPYLAIGSPYRNFDQGGVKIVNWRSTTFHGPYSWHTVGGQFEGSDRHLGQSVGISRDGGRVVASSMEIHGDRSYVNVMDRTTFFNYNFSTLEPMGGSPALNSQGSIVAIASCTECGQDSSNNVQVFLDDSAFCAVPLPSSDDSTPALEETFAKRDVCRSGTTLAADERLCSQSVVFLNGEYEQCSWVPALSQQIWAPSVASTAYGSVSPSENPTTLETVPPTSFGDVESPQTQPSTAPTTPSPSSASQQNSTFSPSPSNHLENTGQMQPSAHSPVNPPSQEPTAAPSTTPFPISPGGFDLRACHCDARGKCINEPLMEGSLLNICVNLGSSNALVSIVDCYLQQGELTVPVIEDRAPVTLGARDDCREGVCEISTPVDSSLFREDAGYLAVVGTVKVSGKRSLRFSQRHLSSTLPYNAVVLLKKMSTIGTESSPPKENPDEEGDGGMPQLAFWLLLALILLVLFALAYKCCRSRSLRDKN